MSAACKRARGSIGYIGVNRVGLWRSVALTAGTVSYRDLPPTERIATDEELARRKYWKGHEKRYGDVRRPSHRQERRIEHCIAVAFHPVRAFVLLSLTLNGAMAMALTGALAFGLRAVTIFDVLAISAFLLGFFNAVGDLIEAEAPALTSAPPSDEDDAASKPAGLNVPLGVASDRRAGSPGVWPLGIDTAATSDDLSAFAPEQRHTRRS